jgi:hypothetical protein
MRAGEGVTSGRAGARLPRVLLRDAVFQRIVRGEITLAFRRWRKPTVRSGGTLRSARGVLAIDEVRPIEAREIDDAQARRAGYAGRSQLLEELRGEGTLYRIALRYQGADERIALRARAPEAGGELAALRAQLAALDRRAAAGPWTRDRLSLLRANPGVRAADLAAQLGMETARFKAEVRKLKDLGLTESLEVGYRISARGLSVLERE